jgi:pyruvate dehydrogenase E2 component (dihydrolipoamide acetyltransferase)
MPALKPFTMPKWGIEMSEGTIAEWMVKENVPFAKGATIALIETDKISNEVEAEADGRFVRIMAQAGETHPVGALLAVLSDGGEASAAEIDRVIAGFRQADTSFSGDSAPAAPALEPATIPDGIAISPAARAAIEASGIDVATLSGSGRKGRITAQDVHQALRGAAATDWVGPLEIVPEGRAFASPMARRLGHLHGISLDGLRGSGAHGRIAKADVLAAMPVAAPAMAPVSSAAPSAGIEIVPMSSMRRTIARRLSASKASIPHFYVRRRVRADRLLAARIAGGKSASVNDYLIHACAQALMEVPALNIQVHDNDIHRFDRADIAVAVATDRGVVTPILFGADGLSVAEIAARMADLARRARAGKLKADEIAGGSFSLSNLGSFGVEQFDAIINPPQGAILAVGAARPEPIDDAGAIRIVPVLHLSLSCDHRAIDGADAGRFLAALAGIIEQPPLP